MSDQRLPLPGRVFDTLIDRPRKITLREVKAAKKAKLESPRLAKGPQKMQRQSIHQCITFLLASSRGSSQMWRAWHSHFLTTVVVNPISLSALKSSFLTAARELGWRAVVIYTAQGTSNAAFADEAGRLHDPSWLASSEHIVDIAKSDKDAGRRWWMWTRVVSTQEWVEEAFKRCTGETQPGQFPSEKALGRNEIMSRSRSPATVREAWRKHGNESAAYIGNSRSSFRQRICADGTLHHHPESSSTPVRRLDALIQMARVLRYQGVGTLAYPVNSHTGERVFLEINPRMQVEYGVSITWPAGRGVHVNTWLCRPGVRECNVGADLDSLLAKILVRGRHLGETTQQDVRALRETSAGNEEGGVKTNKTVLAERGSAIRYGWSAS
ncbi:hypothetical protein FIBSPDRAFT_889020 [Athelia psychrophila]|uniref:Carbamoyl phosphate synthase ATP-binding domain-containing protein n=1 Tax=Athelia psychrophila TaxID=1759441 RepID=A0A166MU76_9AGAM|nr:hypothetical protein FIBSPDRAFT_889020 [Fibularhizoctonia sp. CBS 109695]